MVGQRTLNPFILVRIQVQQPWIMRKIFNIFLLCVFILLPLLYFTYSPFKTFLNQYIYFSYCDKPLRYSIGTVDPRFNISQSEFLQDIKQAQGIWENINQKNLFEYDSSSLLNFSMVYDNRQSLNTQIGGLEGKLDSGKSKLDSNIREYQALVDQFNQKRRNLNDEISYWNSRGGAPKDEYDKLVAENQQLKQEADRLSEMARNLNLSTSEYNTQVGELNQTINSFKNAISLQPEEGLYDGKEQKITIYITNSKEELVHTLAHEMGHALGIEHVQNDKAIMFPFSTPYLVPTVDDKMALETICRKQNKYEVLAKNLYSGFRALARRYNIAF